jgi:hypothetical protein
VTGDRAAQAAERVLDLLAGRCRSQAVSTAAALGLAERLAAGPRSVEALAAELQCDPDALERLLDLLAGLELCRRVGGRRFELLPDGAALRDDALGPLAAFLGSAEAWNPWSALRDSLATGSPCAFERMQGRTLYEHLARTPAASARYDAAIEAFTRDETEALCRQFDFSDVRRLLDVGGGRGTALMGLLARWPHLRGVFFDLPHVVESTGPELLRRFPERVELVGGDFRESLPRGAEACLLKHVLHNWDDAGAGELLRRCAASLGPGGRVLVIEAILAPDTRVDAARLLDLEMLVLTGGRERRKPELRRLFHDAGLALARVAPLTPASWLLVGTRRDQPGRDPPDRDPPDRD